ncbi:hypothetical protein ACR0ST_12265 [Aliidiomarina sp. Khilg15.8]
MTITEIILIPAIFIAPISCEVDQKISAAENVTLKSTALPDAYKAVCSMVELHSPKISASDSGTIQTQAHIYLTTGELLSSTWMVVEVIDDMYVSTACLPMKKEYRVQITINHHPEKGLSLCPKRLLIEDLMEFSTLGSD